MSVHKDLTGLELHQPWNFIQETDPGAVGAGLHWLQVSTANVFRRKNDNSGWLQLNGGALNDPTTTKGDIIARSSTILARLPVGTNGQALVADSTATLGVKWGDVSLTLPAWVTKKPEATPASPNAFDDEFDTGSLGGSWAWKNQNGSTATFAGSKLAIDKSTLESPCSILYKPISSTFTLTTRLWANGLTTTNGHCGLVLCDSGSNRSLSIGHGPTGYLLIVEWTSNTTFSSQLSSPLPFSVGPSEIYLRAILDSTNITFYYSFDGDFFTQAFQHAKATWLTSGVDGAGLYIRTVDVNPGNLIADYIRRT